MAEELQPFLDSLVAPTAMFGEQVQYHTEVAEHKGKKEIRRLFVVGKHRVWYCEIKKKGFKLLANFHFYSIASLESNGKNLVLTPRTGKDVISFFSSDESTLVSKFASSVAQITCCFPSEFITVQGKPGSQSTGVDIKQFRNIYFAYCDMFNKPVCRMTLEYIANQFEAHTHTLVLESIPITEGSDFGPLIATLQFDDFFRELIICDFKVDYTVPLLTSVLKSNKTLTKLVLSNINLSETHIVSICEAIQNNPSNGIQLIDFSGNKFDIKGATALSQMIRSLPHALIALDVSRCQLTPKACQIIVMTLAKVPRVALPLETLILSGNRLEVPGTLGLEEFCKEYKSLNKIKYLDVSNTGIAFNVFQTAKLMKKLKHLNISGNSFDKMATDLLSSLLQQIPIERLNMSHCTFTTEGSLRTILSALAKNEKLKEIKLNIAEITEPKLNIAHEFTNIPSKFTSLNFSDISIKESLIPAFLDAIQKQTQLRKLHLDGIFNSKTANPQISEALVDITKMKTLTTLSISRWNRSAVIRVLECFPETSCLQKLSIAQCGLGDTGVSSLLKALGKNRTMKYLNVDDNGVGIDGFMGYGLLLSENKTIGTLLCEKDYAAEHGRSGAMQSRLEDVLANITKALMRSSTKGLSIWVGSERKQTITQLPQLDKITPLAKLPSFFTGEMGDDQDGNLDNSESDEK